ncbi:hypothetical protein Cmtc_21880 [Cupriavidus sp. TKC]|nr:hypothetical protein Cmtc_21880 [Cupriavidus sp. TKC]
MQQGHKSSRERQGSPGRTGHGGKRKTHDISSAACDAARPMFGYIDGWYGKDCGGAAGRDGPGAVLPSRGRFPGQYCGTDGSTCVDQA